MAFFKKKRKSLIRSLVIMCKKKNLQPIIVPVEHKDLLAGKVALITGGSSGIGYAIAEAFLKCGAKVIITGRNQDKLNSALHRLDSQQTNIKGICMDVRDIDSLQDKMEQARISFSEGKIDILVNSAGVNTRRNFWRIEKDEYDSIMDTNVKGTFFLCQVVARKMVEQKIQGHILNISSSSALRPAWTPYEMSKWAVRGFTSGLADELIQYGITVNAIAPGATATPMLNKAKGDSISRPFTPGKRYVMPEEVASLAVYMVSGCGDMIIGDTVYMTSGSGVISLHK